MGRVVAVTFGDMDGIVEDGRDSGWQAFSVCVSAFLPPWLLPLFHSPPTAPPSLPTMPGHFPTCPYSSLCDIACLQPALAAGKTGSGRLRWRHHPTCHRLPTCLCLLAYSKQSSHHTITSHLLDPPSHPRAPTHWAPPSGDRMNTTPLHSDASPIPILIFSSIFGVLEEQGSGMASLSVPM